MAENTASIESSLSRIISEVQQSQNPKTITLQVGMTFVSGTIEPAKNETDRGKLILQRASIFVPEGVFMRPPVWECRLEAITGFALDGLGETTFVFV